MFRFMRNIHLALGVTFFFVACLFAFSSIVIIYRPWFPGQPHRSSEKFRLHSGAEARTVARWLMRDHGYPGDLRDVRPTEAGSSFQIWQASAQVDVTYSRQSGETSADVRRFNLFETLVRLHINHGFWHDSLALNLWAVLSLGVSAGLILLGVSGIYLWYAHPRERLVGNLLIATGFLIPVTVLIITRIQGS